MANKKLYSLRVDVDLLDALRAKADESGKTVSELMTTYCQKGLIEDSEADDPSTKQQASASTLAEPVAVGAPLEISDRVAKLIEGLQSQIDELKRDLQQASN